MSGQGANIAGVAGMTMADYVASAKRDLEELEELLRDAAARGQALDDIIDEALALLHGVQDVLATADEDEGTE
jgi:hypothetical protein